MRKFLQNLMLISRFETLIKVESNWPCIPRVYLELFQTHLERFHSTNTFPIGSPLVPIGSYARACGEEGLTSLPEGLKRGASTAMEAKGPSTRKISVMSKDGSQ